MNGTVAPPSSNSTAARTCSVLAAMSWAMRCSMLSMGGSVSLRWNGSAPATGPAMIASAFAAPGKQTAPDTTPAPRLCDRRSGVERTAVCGGFRGSVLELAGAAVQHQRAGDQVVQALLAAGEGHHDEADAEDDRADELGAVAAKRAQEADASPLQVGDPDAECELADGGLPG